jgi:hypothetical protein
MADLADVENALVVLVTNALYPEGAGTTCSVGADCRIYRGWPTPAGLDADLQGGIVNVSVWPDAAPGQMLTRLPSQLRGQQGTPTLTASISRDSVTFDGTATAGQLVGLRTSSTTFSYRTTASDTPATIAANLASMIRNVQAAQTAGPTLIVPGAFDLTARIVADAPAVREIRRQTHDLRISFWCPSPLLRDAATALVDTTLADLTFVELADSSVGRLVYKTTSVFDQSQSAILYRRDLIYSVEYPTTISVNLPAMLFGDIALGSVNLIA